MRWLRTLALPTVLVLAVAVGAGVYVWRRAAEPIYCRVL